MTSSASSQKYFKYSIVLIILLIFAFIFYFKFQEEKQVKEIVLSNTFISLEVGSKEKITYTLVPNVKDKKVLFTSSDSKIAIVTEDGTVQAVSKGNAIITCSIGDLKETVFINVLEKVVPIRNIQISGPKEVMLGEKIALTAKIEPDNATIQEVLWSTSDSSIATIDKKGTLLGIKEGVVEVVAKASSKSAKYQVRVKGKERNIPVEKIELSVPNLTLEIGKEYKVNVRVLPTNATDKNLSYKSSDNNIVVVTNTGLITAKRVGNAKVTITSNNGKVAVLSIQIIPKIVHEVFATAIQFTENQHSLFVGDRYKPNIVFTPNNTTDKTITWSSSNPSVAYVDNNGNITGKLAGEALIMAKTKNQKVATLTIVVSNKTFQNPILSGADPFVTKKNGVYYLVFTSGASKIDLYTSTNLYQFTFQKTIYQTTATIWAPEMHFIDNHWYVYYTKPSGSSNTSSYLQRMYVLRSKTSDPLGEYEDLGLLNGMTNHYAIDGTIMHYMGNLYFIWSGLAGSSSSSKTQNLYIAHMKNPYTIDSNRVLIASPTYSFEKYGGYVNEAPQVLEKNGIIHIIYSASGANNVNYCLGRLTLTGGNPLSKSSWTKNKSCVFQSANDLYGVGHASFVKSPNGKEDWMVYHAYDTKEDVKNWNRKIRIQKFTWDQTTPNFGKPIAKNKSIVIPS